MGAIKTYNPKEVTVSFGPHIVTGYAEDSFVSIEPAGDGITKKVGCDGEIVRSVSPDDTGVIKLVLLQTSPTNAWLQKRANQDVQSGNGTFPVLVKDLRGGLVCSTDSAWVTRFAARSFGRESANREWEIQTGSLTIRE